MDAALLLHAMRDDSTLAADIRYQLINFMLASKNGKKYHAALHAQKLTSLLDQLALQRYGRKLEHHGSYPL